MKNNCEYIKLSDVFEVKSSKRVLESDWKQTGVPFYRAREVVKLAQNGFVDNELFIAPEQYKELTKISGAPKEGDIIISAVGTLGYCYLVKNTDKFYFKDASVLWFQKTSNKVHSKYIEHAIKSDFINNQIKKQSRGATVGTLTIEGAKNLTIPLPPLEEQKRIASILDKANELKEKRKKAIEKLDELVQSVFIDMFGDPVENPKNWEIVTFDKLMTEIYYGTSKTPEYLDQGIAFVRATNVKNGKIVHNDMKFMGQSFADSIPHCKLKKGDMIIVRSGVNTGDCAIFRDEYPQAYAAYDLIIKLPSQISEFYNFLFNTDYKERVIKPLTRRAGQPHINSEQIKSLLVIKPPTVLIDKFTSYLIKSFEINKKNDKSLCDIESLQASLHNIFFQRYEQ